MKRVAARLLATLTILYLDQYYDLVLRICWSVCISSCGSGVKLIVAIDMAIAIAVGFHCLAPSMQQVGRWPLAAEGRIEQCLTIGLVTVDQSINLSINQSINHSLSDRSVTLVISNIPQLDHCALRYGVLSVTR